MTEQREEVMPDVPSDPKPQPDTAPASTDDAGGGAGFDFTASMAETIKRFDDLPASAKADYARSKAIQYIRAMPAVQPGEYP